MHRLRDRTSPPLGKLISFNMDIVGGATSSLCEVLRQAVVNTPAGIFVNMLFDHDMEQLHVRGPYPSGVLRVTIKEGETGPCAPLWIRAPSWMAVDEMRPRNVGGTASAGNAVECVVSGSYLLIPKPTGMIEIDMPLPESQLVLHHRTREIVCRMRGHQVVAMGAPPGADLRFFGPL